MVVVGKISRKKKIIFGIVAIVIVCIVIYYVKNLAYPKIDYLRHCYKITMETQDHKYTLNLLQKEKLLNLINKNSGSCPGVTDVICDVTIDFHNGNTLEVDTKGSHYGYVHRNGSKELLYLKDNVIDYVKNIVY